MTYFPLRFKGMATEIVLLDLTFDVNKYHCVIEIFESFKFLGSSIDIHFARKYWIRLGIASSVAVLSSWAKPCDIDAKSEFTRKW
ncbi:hypothetical protein QYM36_000676 [Artemia franciscana]|uniref:Uncharacterized protein n=1 Tax=Artemia franciscana TaxID=6661 RepID=A0AA88IFK6_ARTSF|nr:hypothetical protein QYM36_000676 [Artemia franciscana]